jgi:23S rRNA (cytosine1962-C5)-methyltransferase
VTFVDAPPALSPSLVSDAQRAGFRAQIERVEQDGVAWLHARESDRQMVDVLVFHPRPAIAADKDAALRTVFEHADLCARLLGEGGILAISPSCTDVDDELFATVLQDGAARTRKRLQILARLGPGPDHPVLAGTPSPPSLVVARVLQSA